MSTHTLLRCARSSTLTVTRSIKRSLTSFTLTVCRMFDEDDSQQLHCCRCYSWARLPQSHSDTLCSNTVWAVLDFLDSISLSFDYCVPSGMVTCWWVPPAAAMESGQKRCSGRFWGVFFLAFGVSEELASSMGCRIRLRAFINLETQTDAGWFGSGWMGTFLQIFTPSVLTGCDIIVSTKPVSHSLRGISKCGKASIPGRKTVSYLYLRWGLWLFCDPEVIYCFCLWVWKEIRQQASPWGWGHEASRCWIVFVGHQDAQTHQLLTCRSVRFVWLAICFFSSSVGYGCCRREQRRKCCMFLSGPTWWRGEHLMHRLTPMCWKSHERMTLVACLGRTPRLFLVELSSWLKRFRSWWNCSWSWADTHSFRHLSLPSCHQHTFHLDLNLWTNKNHSCWKTDDVFEGLLELNVLQQVTGHSTEVKIILCIAVMLQQLWVWLIWSLF